MQEHSLAAFIFIENVGYTFLMLLDKNAHINTSLQTVYLKNLSLINTILNFGFPLNTNINNTIAIVGLKMSVNL